MKRYPKTYNNLSKEASKKFLDGMSSSIGSVEELAITFKEFLRSTYLFLFNAIVKEVWLEQGFIFNGARRVTRCGNGYYRDWAFSYFTHRIVGISPKYFSSGPLFTAIPTYFKDFFPNFSDHNPFKDPEYFKYPYNHVTLDHLCFVYQCHNRLELIQEAEEKSMNIKDFRDWSTNAMFCYNAEIGEELYSIIRHGFIPCLKNKKYGKR